MSRPTGSAAFEQSGPSLRLVLGIIALLAIVLGVLGYYRYAQSETHFVQAQAEIDAAAKHLDVEGCVSVIIDWHDGCEANRPLCDHGVPMMMTHCLKGRDRAQDCQALDLSSARAQWVFQRCTERGTPCKSRQRCPCADAYRALDSFCRHDQQGVAM